MPSAENETAFFHNPLLSDGPDPWMVWHDGYYYITPIPDAFARTIVGQHGEAGREWLRTLPERIAYLAAQWELTVGPPFAPLSYNYVAPARRADGTKVVLKVGVPHREPLTEIAALRLLDGHGIARLLDADEASGALLLERVAPGTMLTDLYPERDDEATAIAASVMRHLWRRLSPGEAHPFPTVADWARGMNRMRAHFGGGTGPFPALLVEEAEALFRDLLASQTETVLLHGDLHHYNILRCADDERGPWLAIDPKGLVGEPAYEVGALLRNPHIDFAAPDAGRLLARRIGIVSEELGIDRARIRGWSLAQAVLSAWWTIEDGGDDWQPAIACAERMAALPDQ